MRVIVVGNTSVTLVPQIEADRGRIAGSLLASHVSVARLRALATMTSAFVTSWSLCRNITLTTVSGPTAACATS